MGCLPPMVGLSTQIVDLPPMVGLSTQIVNLPLMVVVVLGADGIGH